MAVVLGTRTAGNVSKAERPTRYAKGGLKDRMITKPCPCILNKGANRGKSKRAT